MINKEAADDNKRSGSRNKVLAQCLGLIATGKMDKAIKMLFAYCNLNKCDVKLYGLLAECLISQRCYEDAKDVILEGLLMNKDLKIMTIKYLELAYETGKELLFRIPDIHADNNTHRAGNATYKSLTLKSSLNVNDSENCLWMKDAIPTGRGGVHDSDGVPYFGTKHNRSGYDIERNYPFGLPEYLGKDELSRDMRRIDQGIYIAYADFKHFGHTVTECVASFSLLLDPCWWSEWDNNISIIIDKRHSMWRRRISKHFKVADSKLVVAGSDNELICVEDLQMAIPSLVMGRYVRSAHCDYLKRFLSPYNKLRVGESELLKSIGSKLYLSRSRLDCSKRLVNKELLLEEELKNKGWCVVHPQDCSIALQLELYARARTICGPIGSAFHMLMAAEIRRDLKLIVLGSNRDHAAATYQMQFDAQGIKCL